MVGTRYVQIALAFMMRTPQPDKALEQCKMMQNHSLPARYATIAEDS